MSRAGRAALWTIGIYRSWISPIRPPSCRFTPSCSAYAMEAIETHGFPRGAWLSGRRVLRCHPWHRGGHDPVPPVVGVTMPTLVTTADAFGRHRDAAA